MEIQPEFSAESNGPVSKWRRLSFWHYLRPILYALTLMLIGLPLFLILYLVVRPDLFNPSEMLFAWMAAVALILGPLAVTWILAFQIYQPWYRTLPVGIEVDNVLETVEKMEPNIRNDACWGNRLRIDPKSDFRLLILIPSGIKARIYSDRNGSEILLYMRRRVSASQRQLFFDFMDGVVDRTVKDKVEGPVSEE